MNEKLEVDNLIDAITNLVVESWRFSKAFENILVKCDLSEQGKYISQYRWYSKKLEENLNSAGMRIVNLEGQAFDSGSAVTPLNLDEFSEDDDLIIAQMLEPVIMGSNGIVKTGTVLLERSK
jgi:hypothetical protein